MRCPHTCLPGASYFYALGIHNLAQTLQLQCTRGFAFAWDKQLVDFTVYIISGLIMSDQIALRMFMHALRFAGGATEQQPDFELLEQPAQLVSQAGAEAILQTVEEPTPE